MIKICFQKMNDGKEIKLICAHEKDYEGSGCYIGLPFDKFDQANSDQKLEILNDMIVAVCQAQDVKAGMKFSDYNRKIIQ